MAKAAGNSYSSPLSSPRRCSTLHILALRVAKQISAYSTYVLGDTLDEAAPVSGLAGSDDGGLKDSASTDLSKVGCSDGTREGFRDINRWPRIAACAGGWQVAGLLTGASRTPVCNRNAGNDSSDPTGIHCSAADMCAATWHACTNGPDVADHSSSGDCAGILSPGEQAFFVVMTGASPQGVCYPDPSLANDLHGCGSIGQPEAGGCPPLDRRMDFAACAATGVWSCGDASDSLPGVDASGNLLEAALVTKPDPSLGGVLCCKD
jgi:hypothetical protein